MKKSASLRKLATLLETKTKLQRIHHISEVNPSQWLNPHVEFSSQKRIETEKW